MQLRTKSQWSDGDLATEARFRKRPLVLDMIYRKT